jgi:DNA-3-methyladenine glycosylase
MKANRLPCKLLERAFFEAAPERVAPRLLGKLLVHKTRGGVLAGRIVEVEAYLGPHNEVADPAAHSHRGPTPRNAVLFGPAGRAYVHSIYGQYFCMNISCEKEGWAGCVLLRALEPVIGLEQMARNRGLTDRPRIDGAKGRGIPPFSQGTRKGWGTGSGDLPPLRQERTAPQGWGNLRELTSGPGRLCQALGIERETHNGLDLLDPDSPLQVRDDGARVERVRVTRRIGIRKAVELPLRFAVAGNDCISGPRNAGGTILVLGRSGRK